MNFGVLDFLQTVQPPQNFTLEGAVTRRVPLRVPIRSVPCKRYCAFRRCSVTNGSPTPADCVECRTHDVYSGTIADEQGQRFRVVEGIPQFSRRVISSSGTLRVVELDHRADPRLRPFVDSCADGLVFHHPAWIESLAQEYGQEPLILGVEDTGGWLRGMLPMFYTRGLPFNIGTQQTGRRLTCLPRTPMAGPLAIDTTAMTLLLRTAVELAKSEHGIQLQIKTPQALPEIDDLVSTPWRPTYVLPLPENSEELRFGDARSRHQLKWGVNKASKSGLKVRAAESESELREWYPLYLETMRRNMALARPYRFFRSLWNQMRPLGLMRVLLVEQVTAAGSRLIAGSVFLSAGKTVFYAFTGCCIEDLGLHPNDLTLWEAIHDACRSGYRYFDFGEVPEEHPELVRFKTKWGAKPTALCRYYSSMLQEIDEEGRLDHDGQAARTVLNRMWQVLPLLATCVLGDWVYSFL